MNENERPPKVRMSYAQAYRYARQSGGRACHTIASFLVYTSGRAEAERTIEMLDQTRPELWT